MSLSDTVKRKTECKIISWHWAHSKELLTFSASGIICLTFWHLATTQVKHSIESLDQGPGEKTSLVYFMHYKTAEMMVEESLWLCFLSNLDAGKPNTWHCRQLLGTCCCCSSGEERSQLCCGLCVCLQRVQLCGMCWSSVLTLSNQCNEACPHRTELPH